MVAEIDLSKMDWQMELIGPLWPRSWTHDAISPRL